MNQVSYENMSVFAKTYHPNAKVTIVDGEYNIVIPVDAKPLTTLPDKFNGTPAAEAFKVFEPEYGSQLQYWATEQCNMGEFPLEGLAELFNAEDARQKEYVQLRNQMFNEKYPDMTYDEWLDSVPKNGMSDEELEENRAILKVSDELDNEAWKQLSAKYDKIMKGIEHKFA